MTKSILDGLNGAGNDENNGNQDSQYSDYRLARNMVNKFLTCDREILVPTRVAGYTVVELARALKVTPENIIQLRTMTQDYWRKVRGRINLKLISLFLNTKFYEK
jgi:hypothetical protein